jgi:hypothetical protein
MDQISRFLEAIHAMTMNPESRRLLWGTLIVAAGIGTLWAMQPTFVALIQAIW